MTITLTEYLQQLAANPALIIISLLTLGVILVNGWTDAPNAIATCVSTRSHESPRKAILMAAVFNFLRRLRHDDDQCDGRIRRSTTWWISAEMPSTALIALCAALCSPSLYGRRPPGILAFPPAKAMH